MIDATIITIAFDGVVLALATAFVLLLLWHDHTKRQIALFTAFLAMVISWNIGTMLAKLAVAFNIELAIGGLALALLEVGFSGSSVAFYAFASTLAGIRSQRFVRLTLAAVGVTILARLVLSNSQRVSGIDGALRLDGIPALFYFSYSALGVYLLFVFRRKIQAGLIRLGAVLFMIGQALTFLNPDLGIVAISTNLSSIGTLLIGIGIIRRELIRPLAERDRQVNTLHSVSKEIAGQPQLTTVLFEISRQAAEWAGGDAAGVFLRAENDLELNALYNLPASLRGYRLPLDAGVCGQAVRQGKSQLIENYARDWRYQPDMPYAIETFGSFIAVPLIYQDAIAGVLFTVSGHQGRLFTTEDVYRLELLGPQAALAIAYSSLIDGQRALTRQVEDSRQQLESLLISTENPVVAVDRKLRMIFANPAAAQLVNQDMADESESAPTAIPREYLPPNLRTMLRDLWLFKVHIYEISVGTTTYQCHLARLGGTRSDGWVAVLNDVTRLKELDRMKGEMIRMVSHDLKNPLMGALLHVDLMRDLHLPPITESLDIVERQLERMDRIIRGVLDLERLRSGRLQLSAHDLIPIVDKTVSDLNRLAREGNITVSAVYEHDEAIIQCDVDQVERAISNLVENALKFTPAGGAVTVKVRESDQHHVVVEVTDTGIGIPEDIQNQVFERFFRGRQRGFEHVSGSGLGLAIVKTIMDSHHGQVSLVSKVGVGTTFSLKFIKPAVERLVVP